ncbi:hypothetical protein [Burkholderia sp. WP9]|uniref:hypothetical protein n=1 Tax=Burkholderia sp. WP9 TaxID=1500263 RepID=UPI0015A5EF49|nr:hypothetical protein [Burkholderia sp. WP9]
MTAQVARNAQRCAYRSAPFILLNSRGAAIHVPNCLHLFKRLFHGCRAMENA